MKGIFKLVAISLVFTLFCGCAIGTASHVKTEGFSVHVCNVPAMKWSHLIHEPMRGNISVSAYPNRVMSLSNVDFDNALAFRLDDKLMPVMIANLEKCVEWGEVAKENKVETTKNLEFLQNSGVASSYGLMSVFMSLRNGSTWGLRLHFSRADAFQTSYAQNLWEDPGRFQTIMVTEENTKLLLKVLKDADTFYAQAAGNHSKQDLFK